MNNLMVKRGGDLFDLEQIYTLEKRIFKNEAWTRGMLKIELLGINDSETLIIEENKLILGYFIYRKISSEYHVLNIGVSPLRQKEGIGSILLKDFLNDLENISTVFLEVKKSNFPAINLYKKNGFKIYGERKNYYKDGSSALLMNCVRNIKYGLV
tara:strand:+ start:612 stop:1076 length:465 start_codon:yes stop_codon:yes gene_type:complete